MPLQNKVIISAVDRTKKAYASATKNTKGLDKATRNLKRTMVSLAAVYSGVQGVKALAAVSDSYQRMNAQIRLVTKEGDNAKETYQDLLDLANDTRSSLDGTVVGYARLARAVATLNIEHEQLLLVSQSINQSFRISGSTQKESYNAIIQLSQGLASGTLRGEEFNAIAEQAPRIMQALRDELGKTDGELRAMSKAGEITSQMILKTLTNQSDTIAKEFAILPVLVEEAYTQLANVATSAFGEVDTSPLIDGMNEIKEVLSDPEVVANLIRWSDLFLGLAGAVVSLSDNLIALPVDVMEGLASAVGGAEIDEFTASAQAEVDKLFNSFGTGEAKVHQTSAAIGLLERQLKDANKELAVLSSGPESKVISPRMGSVTTSEDKNAVREKQVKLLAKIFVLEKANADVVDLHAAAVDSFKDTLDSVKPIEYSEANSWFKQTRTDAEEYDATIKKLGEDFRNGDISPEVYNRAFTQTYDEYTKGLDRIAKARDADYNKLISSLRTEEEVKAAAYAKGYETLREYLGDTVELVEQSEKLKAKIYAKDKGINTGETFAELLKLLQKEEDAIRISYEARKAMIENADLGATAERNLLDELKDKMYPEQDGFWEGYATDAETALEAVTEMARDMADTFTSGMGDAFESAIIDGENLSDAFDNVMRSMLGSMINFFVTMAAEHILSNALRITSDKAVGATYAKTTSLHASATVVQAGLNAFASTAAIPIYGPAIAPAAAAAAVAATTPMATAIHGLSFAAVAHGGLTNVPKETTYLLDKGERVLSPNQNKDFTDFIQGRENGSQPTSVNVTFNINAMDTAGATEVINSQRGNIVSIVRSAFHEAGTQVAI